MSFVELFDFIIYQHLNKRTKILPLATSQIAHLCNQLIMFALPISMQHFKSIIFYQNSPKIVIFATKCKIFERWGLRHQTPVPLAAGGFAPQTPQSPAAGGSSPNHHPHPPIANFWLRACLLRYDILQQYVTYLPQEKTVGAFRLFFVC